MHWVRMMKTIPVTNIKVKYDDSLVFQIYSKKGMAIDSKFCKDKRKSKWINRMYGYIFSNARQLLNYFVVTKILNYFGLWCTSSWSKLNFNAISKMEFVHIFTIQSYSKPFIVILKHHTLFSCLNNQNSIL